MLKIDDYIKVNNYNEFINIQKYLFNLDYSWTDDTKNVIYEIYSDFPNYIMIEMNHKNIFGNLMFSHSHFLIKNSKIHDANILLRKEKIKKINNEY